MTFFCCIVFDIGEVCMHETIRVDSFALLLFFSTDCHPDDSFLPSRHAQVKLPKVFVHSACMAQGRYLHSLTSDCEQSRPPNPSLQWH